MNKMHHRDKALGPGKHARHLMKERKYSEAEQKYQEALELDPDDVFSLVGLGDLKRKQNDLTRRFPSTKKRWKCMRPINTPSWVWVTLIEGFTK